MTQRQNNSHVHVNWNTCVKQSVTASSKKSLSATSQSTSEANRNFASMSEKQYIVHVLCNQCPTVCMWTNETVPCLRVLKYDSLSAQRSVAYTPMQWHTLPHYDMYVWMLVGNVMAIIRTVYYMQHSLPIMKEVIKLHNFCHLASEAKTFCVWTSVI